MKYVKLIALPNTWFKEGTEVYNYDAPLTDKKRVTLEEWEKCKAHPAQGILVRGIRVCTDNRCEIGMGFNTGEERGDGEWCHISEFKMEIVEE